MHSHETSQSRSKFVLQCCPDHVPPQTPSGTFSADLMHVICTLLLWHELVVNQSFVPFPHIDHLRLLFTGVLARTAAQIHNLYIFILFSGCTENQCAGASALLTRSSLGSSRSYYLSGVLRRAHLSMNGGNFTISLIFGNGNLS